MAAACQAAAVSMRFSPDGTVHACCANDDYPLGRIDEATVDEIWAGARIRRLRAALDEGDLSLGCQGCGVGIETGDRASTAAAMYDRYPAGVAEWPRRLEFALSNTCNLQCVHCSGELSSAIRSQREHRAPLVSPYDEPFFDQIAPYLVHLEVAVFIGGEPFLTRECQRMWDLLIERDLHPEVHVTTNATVWNDRVAQYVRALQMRVAVSVDGFTAATNEAMRVGSDHAQVTRNRARLRAVMAEWGGELCVNHCLMVHNWHELGEVLCEADDLGDTVYVIPVEAPAVYSVFRQPLDDLRHVVRTLEAQSPALEARLQRNRDVWVRTVGQLRGHLRRMEVGEVPVQLSGRNVADVTQAVTRATEAMQRLTDRVPMQVRVEQGVMAEVQVQPEWATVLDPRSWIGQRVEAVLELLSAVGPMGRFDLDRSTTGVNQVCAELTVEGEAVTVRSMYINPHAPESFLVLSLAGPLPAG